jgi:predicted transcriptional regulator
MTVTLELKPEIEARIRARAAERGLPVEKLIEAAIEVDVTRGEHRPFHETATLEEWEAALDEFIQRNAGRNVSWTVDDSRESIYREREDAQL